VHAIFWIQVAAATAMCGVAAWEDHLSGRISNRLTFTGMAVGGLLGALDGGLHGLAFQAIAAFAAALVPLILFRAGAMGGGDVKLFFALGALLGAGPALETEMLAFLFGALHGGVLWYRQGLLGAGLKSIGLTLCPGRLRRASENEGVLAAKAANIRFGPSIFAAELVIVVSGIVR
jgi:prepilin peptidase CpaA